MKKLLLALALLAMLAAPALGRYYSQSLTMTATGESVFSVEGDFYWRVHVLADFDGGSQVVYKIYGSDDGGSNYTLLSEGIDANNGGDSVIGSSGTVTETSDDTDRYYYFTRPGVMIGSSAAAGAGVGWSFNQSSLLLGITHLKFEWVSVTGGTSPTIDVKLHHYNAEAMGLSSRF